MQTQDEGLRQAEQIYSRMHSIASLAADPTTDDDTRSLLNDEFKILLEASSDLNGSAFNNVPLIDPRASTKQYPVDFRQILASMTLQMVGLINIRVINNILTEKSIRMFDIILAYLRLL